MKPISSFVTASLLTLGCASYSHAEDYQKLADATVWKFSQEQASVFVSLLRFPNEYQVELIRPKNKFGPLTIRLVNDGKEIYSWEGHARSVFTANGEVLVYAEYSPSRTGCTVVAYDLKKQKQVWKTPLQGLGPIDHFYYANSVNLEVVNNEVARVFGKESDGQYLEFLDLKTGKTVGRRVYGK